MIVRLWSLALLATQLALGFDHSIDLNRCKSETACFIRESCLEDNSNPQLFPDSPKKLVHHTDKDLKGDCDVVIQMKRLSKKMFHVMIQVKANTGEKLKENEVLKLNQRKDKDAPEKTVFSCKRGSAEGRTKITAKNVGPQVFNDTHIFCSFTVTMDEKVSDLNEDSPDKPILAIPNDKNELLEFGDPGANMWLAMKGPPLCDHSEITSPEGEGPDPDILRTEIDTFASPPFKCDNGGKLFVKAGSTPAEDPAEVICSSNTGEWKLAENSAALTSPITIYCEEKVCRKCDTIQPTRLEPCTGCNDFTLTAATAEEPCPTLKCQEHDAKWTTDGEKVFDGEAKCKKSTSDPSKYSWFVKEVELEKAACLKLVDCAKPAVEKNCQPPGGADCKLEIAPEKISCKKDYQLILKTKLDEVEGVDVSSLQCNHKTGFYFDPSNKSTEGKVVDCRLNATNTADQVKTGSFMADNGYYVFAGAVVVFVIAGVIIGFVLFSKKKKKKAAPSTNKTSNSTRTKTVTPGDPTDGSEKKKSMNSAKEKKFKLEDYPTWTNDEFEKIILPNFKTCEPEGKTKWVRNCLGRFYAYCNTKKTPESGTSKQFWLIVKQCMDDKCEDGGVWRELFRIAFTMAFTPKERSNAGDEFHLLVMKPFLIYMREYLNKCDYFKRKDEPRAETEMRVICLEVLLHTQNMDVCEKLRTLTFNEKLEVPLRALTAACYTRERDDKPATVQLQYKRVVDKGVLDPHIAEGWGNYLQHILFGLAGYLITVTETYQYYLFDAIYQFPNQKEVDGVRNFSPTDWLYAYKGALLHENSAQVALEMFKKMNEGSLLHIEALLKQRHKEEEKEEREKTREQYRRDMKEYTMMLADLLVGEEEFNEFKSNLRFVILFLGETAMKGEELSEERVRERAINMGNMIRDRDFAKQANESLKAIGAKTSI